MNVMQKKDDPQAYQPEIVKTIQLKQLRDTEEQQKREEKERLKQEKIEEDKKHEKALFDFDHEIDDLEKVEERYPAQKIQIVENPCPTEVLQPEIMKSQPYFEIIQKS